MIAWKYNINISLLGDIEWLIRGPCLLCVYVRVDDRVYKSYEKLRDKI